jgi:NAD(P)-dependent dehydrogenase (short-subunit alcohol dehydrogenase family)
MTEADRDAVFAVDLKGAWLCAKHVLPGMREARGVDRQHRRSTPRSPSPACSCGRQSGLVGLMRSLALDRAARHPGECGLPDGRARIWWRSGSASSQTRGPRPVSCAHPMRCIATPAEIANVVAFVASDDASAMTGASVAVDCGLGVQFAT